MADQTVKIERDDAASVAYEMAERLWFNEYKKDASATDLKFIQLVNLCSLSLRSQNFNKVIADMHAAIDLTPKP